MSVLYLYNRGRDVCVDLEEIHIEFMGPKSLVCFLHVNKLEEGVLSVETQFRRGVEEEYIDLGDLFREFHYDEKTLLTKITGVEIKEVENTREAIQKQKMDLIQGALMVSDNLALFSRRGSAGDLQIQAINMDKAQESALVRFRDLAVLRHNMPQEVLKRAVDAVRRNKELIEDEVKEAGEDA